MITKIRAKNFKGLSFVQDIDKYNLLTGPMGGGKTSRLLVLQLSVLGYLPSDQKKKPGDIFATHSCNGEDFSVGIENEKGNSFGRTFTMDAKGSVSMRVFYKGKTLKKEEIGLALSDFGAPNILDLSTFNGLSDKGKIDFLFELYPPEGDLNEITQEIETLSEKEKSLTSEKKTIKGTIERLTKSKSEIEVPAGTLPDVQAEILKTESELEQAQKDLNELKTQEREKIATTKAQKEAEKQAEREKKNREIAEAVRLENEKLSQTNGDENQASGKAGPADDASGSRDGKGEPGDGAIIPTDGGTPESGDEDNLPVLKKPPPTVWQEITADIVNIIAVMAKSGCEDCVAKIILKSKAMKYAKKGNA